MQKIEHILKELKNEVSYLYGKRLCNVILFGSWARGEVTKYSDIDLMFVLKGRVKKKEIEKISDITYNVSLKYNTEIFTIAVSENKYKTNNEPLYMNIRKEGINIEPTIFEKDKFKDAVNNIRKNLNNDKYYFYT